MLRKKFIWGFMPVLLAGLMFLGGCHRPSPEKIADRIVEELTTKLELSAMQQQQLNTTKAELLGKLAELKKSHESIHDGVMAELQKDTLDQGQLKKMAASHKAEMDVVADLLIDRLAAFHGTLTPDQKKKLVEFVKEKDKCRKHCFFGD
jgi:periplasmic protein CpxP/Spy